MANVSKVGLTAILLAILCACDPATSATAAAVDWPCERFARTPVTCTLEQFLPQRKIHVSRRLVDERLLNRLGFEKAAQVWDIALLSAASDVDERAELYLKRGMSMDAIGRRDDALCDYQASVALGHSDALSHAEESLQKRLKQQELRLGEFTALNTVVAASRSGPDGLRHLSGLASTEWRYAHVHHSTAIEGNPLSLSEVRGILESHASPPAEAMTPAVLEVIGTDKAYWHAVNASGYLLKDSGVTWAKGGTTGPPLSLSLLLELHRRVLLDKPGEAGAWRTEQVYVSGHRPPPPTDVPGLMARLEAHWSSAEFSSLHPIEQAALAHFEMARVHPCVDGNGRTARLLSSYLLMRAGYPPLNLRLEDRPRYFAALAASHPRQGGCTARLIDLAADTVAGLMAEAAHATGLQQHQAVNIAATGEQASP